jgi:hypothetical protein
MEQKITNAVLLARLDERMNSQDKVLEQIHSQALKTNGRILAAESDIEALQHWRTKTEAERSTAKVWIIGIATVVGFIIGSVITIFYH